MGPFLGRGEDFLADRRFLLRYRFNVVDWRNGDKLHFPAMIWVCDSLLVKVDLGTVIFSVLLFDVLNEESEILVGVRLGNCEVAVASVLFLSCGGGSKQFLLFWGVEVVGGLVASWYFWYFLWLEHEGALVMPVLQNLSKGVGTVISMGVELYFHLS